VDATVTDPMVGRLLDDRYRVEERIARGGMATVYRATDTRLDRQVALKIMQPAFADDPEFVSRFTREARASARLSDPHVVAVYDQGEDDGVVFLAMEYIPGRTLRDLLTIRGRLTPRETVNVMIPVVEALAAAHRAGMVHRDVKPENVLIGDDGRVRVADFGLARAANASGSNNATRGVIIGTVAYLAPEQVSPGISDERSDVYAAGILMYELLTGRPPYDGEEPIAVAYRHVHEAVPAPSAIVSDAAPLDPVVSAATQREPADRPANATALLQMLQGLPPLDVGSTDSQPTVVVSRPSQAAAAATTPTRSTAVTPMPDAGVTAAPTSDDGAPPPLIKKRRARGFIALFLVLALAVGAGAFAWWIGAGRYTEVPGVNGLVAKQAESKLAAAGLEVDYAPSEFSEVVPEGEVIASNPEAGERIADGGTVTLTLSKGKERYDVPNLVGVSRAEAGKLLAERNLVVGAVKSKYSETVDKGLVISSSPKDGKSVRRDTAVDLVVSKGPKPIPVPNLVGDNVEDARATLESLGLTLRVSDEKYTSKVPEGAVISQDPSSDASLTSGGTVSVVVSLGPPLVEVPSVVRRSTEDATNLLTDAGFDVNVNEACVIVCIGRVVDQNPNGGSKAPIGSTVTITIV
jgi:beta-lactam-binding protein with PASTA domain/predicted Ser/Thr protein kinase